MASYRLEWKPSVHNDFRKIGGPEIPRIIERAEQLAQNPHPADSKKLKDAHDSYRIRIGDYRLIYQIDKREKIVLIQTVRHRKDAYRKR